MILREIVKWAIHCRLHINVYLRYQFFGSFECHTDLLVCQYYTQSQHCVPKQECGSKNDKGGMLQFKKRQNRYGFFWDFNTLLILSSNQTLNPTLKGSADKCTLTGSAALKTCWNKLKLTAAEPVRVGIGVFVVDLHLIYLYYTFNKQFNWLKWK